MNETEKDLLIASLKADLKIARKNEKRLNTLIQSAPFCIHEINLKGQIISMNNAGLKMMEMEREEDICGVHYIDFVAAEQRESIWELLRDAFQGKFSTFEFTPENSDLIFTSCFAPVFSEDGSVERVMGITEDITLQRKNEQELMTSRRLTSIGTLAGGIAHDFNNILTGLFGNLQLARRSLPTEHSASKYLEKANYAMDEATRLSNQLLTFAKGGEPKLEIVDLEKLIRESLSFVLGESDINITFDCPRYLWKVKADIGQLSQVIDNLLINAKQAMKGSGHLTIKANNAIDVKQSQDEGLDSQVVEISIIDDGEGIAESNLDKIFDPYFTTKHLGSGLGLATVYSIIKKHQGTVDVVSEVGIGTSFSICLPAEKGVSLNSASESNNANLTNLRPLNVLVMDDEPMILDVFVDMLGVMGHTVETSSCGEGALALYVKSVQSGTPFDVVILDLTIAEGKGGEEIIGEFVGIESDVVAIATSAYSKGPIMSHPQKFGFRNRLIKPFNLSQLESLIGSLF